MKIYAIEFETIDIDGHNWNTNIYSDFFETEEEAKNYIPTLKNCYRGFGRNYHVINYRNRMKEKYETLLAKTKELKNTWNF